MYLIKNKIVKKDIITGKILLNEELSLDMTVVDDIDKHISEYRKLFSGVRLKSIGNLPDVREKLLIWLSANKQYTMTDIINVTNSYLSQVQDRTYIPNADNFIYDKSGNSTLSIAFEYADMNQDNKLHKHVT